ncbi:MAG: hypothetical protein Q4F95_07465 [Oscillospiraceae bacterium]|nr:hypothetical protein [Oscillospiraceae bacterium]
MTTQVVGNNLMVNLEGETITVTPPKMRTIREMNKLSNDDFDSGMQSYTMILSKNTEGKEITVDMLLDYDIADIKQLASDITDWIENLKKK